MSASCWNSTNSERAGEDELDLVELQGRSGGGAVGQRIKRQLDARQLFERLANGPKASERSPMPSMPVSAMRRRRGAGVCH